MPGQQVGGTGNVSPGIGALNTLMRAHPELNEPGTYISVHPELGPVQYVNTNGVDGFAFLDPETGATLNFETDDTGNNNIYGEAGESIRLGVNGQGISVEEENKDGAANTIATIFSEAAQHSGFLRIPSEAEVEELMQQVPQQ
ncbi:MAG: hypothetical protein SFZ03_00985 [Candidatus Melainabacteria bacterium]|nr:hypothetical protein [Candidatus Melainabacteria bacterium]